MFLIETRFGVLEWVIMGNVSGREEKSNKFDNVDYFMECGHGQGQVSSNSSNSYRAHMPHQVTPACLNAEGYFVLF